MKKIAMAGLTLVLLGGISIQSRAEEMPQMPKPGKEHKWLGQFVGTWSTKIKAYMEPGKPPMQTQSSESFHTLGGFWVVGNAKCDMMGPYASQLTIGYDPAQKKYVGTWIDSAGNYMWRYTGSVDATGKKLTLNTQGPCPMKPGKMVNFREVTEFKSRDHRVFTSSMQGEDGKWTTLMTMESWRKK